MIFPDARPRLYTLPPGVDFPERLAEGLIARHAGQPPEAMARVTVFLNTNRMRRRLRAAFHARGALILPRLRVVTDLADDPLLIGAGERVSPLGRRLELAVLIDRLLTAQPDLAPRAALYELADSLAGLMDELRAEDVSPETLAALDMEGHAAHWSRTRAFVSLIAGFFGPGSAPDREARQRMAVEAQIALWAAQPPTDPVILAGSTGSRRTTLALMLAVAHLPQGAILVPGYDAAMPLALWPTLEAEKPEVPGQEDHPQYRYWRLMQDLGLSPEELRRWDDLPPVDEARNRLISLALRPAPVTDQWISEGPALGDLVVATAGMTLIEATTPRAEAQAIALRLRRAVTEGRRAVLISPDRELTRRVTAALDRWGLRPDDSAGQPLMHSPPGRLLRMIARGMGRRLSADQVLALLKHPLAFSGGDRGLHLLLLRELELKLRRSGPAYPDRAFLSHWAAARKEEAAPLWAARLSDFLEEMEALGPAPLADLVVRHRAIAAGLARGATEEPALSGGLWDKAAGESARAAMDEVATEAPAGFTMRLGDYSVLLDGIFARYEVRDTIASDDRIEILGPQEARIVGAPLVVLAGLNEGVWPAQPTPDPWLNRKMRLEAGLLLPERRIGLSAHDFQMAVAAPEVVLTRAARNAEAETVSSRWLNRLTNLLEGLEENHGPAALAAMRARGRALLEGAVAVEAPIQSTPMPRPSPRPPLHLRPRRLSLTEVERLIRDPYAIYARHVLRLNPLSPLRPMADARLRGEVLHRVPEKFLKTRPLLQDPAEATQLLMQITDEVLEADVAWPAARAAWRARMAELARAFVESVLAGDGTPVALEKKYEIEVPGLDFRLVGKPDRIDVLEDGRLSIIDYKTGAPPSVKQQAAFAKQLHLAAVMASLGAFPEVGPHDAVHIAYVQLKRELKEIAADLGPADLEKVLKEFRALISAYRDPMRGYTSRRAMVETALGGDYDDLARYGEWGVTDAAVAEDLI